MKEQDIVHGLEFHSRLLQEDGRPMRPGLYSLRFALHADARIQRSSWSEAQAQVQVGALGHFHVVLGSVQPMETKQFDGRVRWVSTRLILSDVDQPELGQRSAILGRSLQLQERIEHLQAVIQEQAVLLNDYRSGPSMSALAARIQDLERRTAGQQEGEVRGMAQRLETQAQQLSSLIQEGGRLDAVEDRLDDMDGPDGDMVDLNERMDAVERGTSARMVPELRRAD